MGKSSKTSDNEQPAATMPITEAYEFKKEHLYIVEYNQFDANQEIVNNTSQYLAQLGYRVLFVPTRTGEALHPVPAVERTDLPTEDSDTNKRQAEAQ